MISQEPPIPPAIADLPPPPRPITPAAARRSWNELSVRGWLLGAAFLTIVAAQLIFSGVSQSRDVNGLLAHGTPVASEVIIHDRDQSAGQPISSNTQMAFRFPWKGKTLQVFGPLPEWTGRRFNGEPVTLHVDPADPGHWTNRSVPLQWWTMITPAWVLLGLAITLAVIALLNRRQKLRIYEVGELVEATATEVRSSPLAPLSASVRCAVPSVRQAVTVLLPRSAGAIARGERIWLILIPALPDRALAAAAYQKTFD